jgi:hypothetical protein
MLVIHQDERAIFACAPPTAIGRAAAHVAGSSHPRRRPDGPKQGTSPSGLCAPHFVGRCSCLFRRLEHDSNPRR